MKPTIYEAAGGKQAFLNLAHAWHERCLADAIVSHPFSHGYHQDHTPRLAAYWAEALGGPPEYTETMGDESFVVRIHAGHGEHIDMDERAIACFALAIEDAGLPADPKLRETLVAYFRWVVTCYTAFSRSADDVPTGMTLAKWGWDGPIN